MAGLKIWRDREKRGEGKRRSDTESPGARTLVPEIVVVQAQQAIASNLMTDPLLDRIEIILPIKLISMMDKEVCGRGRLKIKWIAELEGG